MPAQLEYEKIIEYLITKCEGVEAGQMFGKKCIKVNKKACVALFRECLVFKLPEDIHADAIALEGSVLWDPSGKGRAMKEWVQVTTDHSTKFRDFARASANYVK